MTDETREGIIIRDGAVLVTLGSGSSIASATLSSPTLTNPTLSGTVIGAASTLISNGIAFINISSGSIGNNGALSGVTALPRIYAEGAYIRLPAGAIAAGVPAAAAWYWCVFSSTTAGTIYNSTYTSGIPVVGTQTAFSTTGPGAYTGITTEVTMIQYDLTAGQMGTNGRVLFENKWTMTNNANAKTGNTKFGGTGVGVSTGTVLTSLLNVIERPSIQNRGSASVQIGSVANSGFFGIGSSGSGITYLAINTAAAVTISRTSTKATATDNIILESVADELLR